MFCSSSNVFYKVLNQKTSSDYLNQALINKKLNVEYQERSE